MPGADALLRPRAGAEPNDPDILGNRANALLALNRAAEALADYDAALAMRPGM